jgi:hypothetical protein
MRVRVTSTVVLAAVAGGLFAYIYFVERHQSSTDQDLARKSRLLRFERRQVRGLTLARRGAKPVVIEREPAAGGGMSPSAEIEGERFSITSPEALPADRGTLAGLVGTLEFLEYRRVVKDASREDPQLGLKDPRLVVTLKLAELGQKPGAAGGGGGREESVRLSFGGASASGDVYVARDDQPAVYLVEKRHFDGLDKGLGELRDARLSPFGREAVTALSWTTSAGEKVALEKDATSGWKLTSPWRMRASRERTDAVLRRLEDLKSTRLLAARAAADAGTYGVTSTSPTLQVTAGQERRTLRVGGPCPAAAGAEGATDKPQVQVVTERGQAVCAPRAALDELMEPAAGLRELRLVQGPEAEVARLVLDRDGKTLALERKAGLWYRAAAPATTARKAAGKPDAAPKTDKPDKPEKGDKPENEADRADATVVRKLFEDLSTFRALDARAVDVKAQGLEKPVARLQLFGEDGQLREELAVGGAVEGHPDRRWVRRGNEAVSLLVHGELLRQIEPDFLRFRRRQVLSFNRFDVKRLTLRRPAGPEEVLEQGEGGWRLTRPTAVAADADLTDRLVGMISDLSAERFVAERPAAEHQLDARALRMEAELSAAASKKPAAGDGGTSSAAGGTYVLEVGASTPGGGCFARAGKGAAAGPVFVLKADSCKDLHQLLATRRPFTLDEAKLTRVVLGGSLRQGELALEKRGPDWYRVAGASGPDGGDGAEPASQERMTELVSALRELRAVEIEGYGAAPAPAALETPRLLVRVTAGGQERTLTVGAPVPPPQPQPQPQPDHRRNPPPTPPFSGPAYARVSGVDVTYAVPPETVQRLATLAP